MRVARIQAREPSSGARRALAVGARHIALLAEEVRSRGTSVDCPLLGALPIAALPTIFGFHLRFRFGRLRRAATVTGSVRAALPGSVNLADTSVFNERLQG